MQLIDGDVAAEVLRPRARYSASIRRAAFFPPASTQFWIVAQGLKTR
ncbi:MAG: hypothetical protein U0790_07995 [Isosphaeraceae bacterium]